LLNQKDALARLRAWWSIQSGSSWNGERKSREPAALND
jgi:hypothetical protein